MDFKDLEKEVDNVMPNIFKKCNIPRYKYIYQCNCAYVDLLVETGTLLCPSASTEQRFLFSLNYNIHLAYRYLKEEETFSYEQDDVVYSFAYKMLFEGYKYAALCEEFPELYSNRRKLEKKNGKFYFDGEKSVREKGRQFDYYMLRKPLNYLLQNWCGISYKMQEDMRAFFMLEMFNSYWGENIGIQDYEPYTAIEGGGLRSFIYMTALKRFCRLYDADFVVRSLRWTELLILFSPEGTKGLRSMIPTTNDEYYSQAFEDCIYKPIGKGDFPKANLADAPLIRTKDGYVFANPWVILFNNSLDTQFLNYLRRHDNKRFLVVKDKIKERSIPSVREKIEQLQGIKCETNFLVDIPGGKGQRELDLLAVDLDGNAVYFEFKHFYIPESCAERKVLDEEFRKALKKMPNQLEAIQNAWKSKKEKNKDINQINKIQGVIVSYLYTGTNVEVSKSIPIINISTVLAAIRKNKTLDGIYKYCMEMDNASRIIPFVTRKEQIEWAQEVFEVELMLLEPKFEASMNQEVATQIGKRLIKDGVVNKIQYDSIEYSYMMDYVKNNILRDKS